MDEGKFTQILNSLLTPDNEVRKAAEQEFEAAKKDHGIWVMQALAHILSTDAPPDIHKISLPLLRRMFARECLVFDTMGSAEQNAVKTNAVTAFTRLTPNSSMNTSVSSMLAALAAKVYYLEQTWDELWGNLLSTLANEAADVHLRQGSCIVLGSCAHVLASYLRSHHDALVGGLLSCLATSCASLRVAAAESLVALIDTVPENALIKYRNIPDHIINALEMSLNASDKESAVTELSCLCTLVENTPKLITGESFGKALNACVQVATTASVPAEVRHVAVEVLIATCESTKLMRSPKKGQPAMALSLIDLLFGYILNPVIEDDWDNTSSETCEAESNSDCDIGLVGIDRVCVAVKPSILGAHIQKLVQENIISPSWNHRQAALALMTYSVEGMKEAYVSYLEAAVRLVVGCTTDENKVVRCNAFQCLSQMCTDFGPDIQLKHYELFLPALVAGLADPIPRVAAMAAAGINAFYDEAESGDDDEMDTANRLAGTIEHVCPALVNLFHNSTKLFVRSTTLSAFSSLIATEKKHMTPYVNTLLPIFQSVLSLTDNPTNPQETQSYKCRAIECTTLLAGSVGFEAFAEYADPVCQFLASIMAENPTTDDPRLTHALRGWTNMVDCMQERVLPYMPSVMPSLLALAKLDCEMEIEAANVGDIEDDEGEEEGVNKLLVNVAGKGEVIVKIKTSLIEDKTTAANILHEFVKVLQDKFAPWIGETTQVAKHLIGFVANSDIRVLGCEIYEQLVMVCAASAPADLPAFSKQVVGVIKEATVTERDYSLIGNYLSLLSVVAKHCGAQLDNESLSLFSQLVYEVCTKSSERRSISKKQMEMMKAADEDEEDIESVEDKIEQEEDNLTNCQAAVEEFLHYVPQFTPMFENDLYSFAGHLVTSNDPALSSVGVAFIASYIEFSTQHSAMNRIGEIIPVIHTIASNASLNADLLHNAFNCYRVITNSLAAVFPQPHEPSVQFVTVAANNIQAFLQGKKTAANAGARNNAVSAAMSIIEHFGAAIGNTAVGTLFALVVASLPLSDADETEAMRVHSTLVRLIAMNHQLVSGQYRASIISKLRDACPECLDSETVATLKTL